MFVKLCHSFGWTHAEVQSLDWDTAIMYWQGITIIEAQNSLIELSIASYPYMKRNAQQKMHKEFHAQAFPKVHDTSRVLTTKELMELIVNGK